MDNPYISYLSAGQSQINSTPRTLIVAEEKTIIPVSLFVTSTVEESLFLDVVVTLQRAAPAPFFLAKHLPLAPYERTELIRGAPLYLAPGDSIELNTDFSSTYCDALICYSKLNETINL